MAGKTGDDSPEDFRDLHNALVNTEGIGQFLREMAVMAARLVGSDLSCAMTMRPAGRPEFERRAASRAALISIGTCDHHR